MADVDLFTKRMGTITRLMWTFVWVGAALRLPDPRFIWAYRL